MAEHLNLDELGIAWKTDGVTIEVGGTQIEFTSEDGTIFRYKDAPMCDFMMYKHEGSWKRSFLTPQAAEKLTEIAEEIGAMIVRGNHPSTDVLEQWWEVEMDDYDDEMLTYQRTGEIPNYEA